MGTKWLGNKDEHEYIQSHDHDHDYEESITDLKLSSENPKRTSILTLVGFVSI